MIRTCLMSPMRQTPLMRRRHEPVLARFCVFLAVLSGLPGCGSDQEIGMIEQEQQLRPVIQRVNENSAAMNFLLRGLQGSASGKYLKASGKLDSFSMTAKLLYRNPRDLFLKLEHTLGGDMEIGSNEREFWVWNKIDEDRYWWGLHENLGPTEQANLPIRPDHIVEVLGLGGIPSEFQPGQEPDFRVLPDRYELRFKGGSSTGGEQVEKVLFIDRRPPYLIRQLQYLRPGGSVALDAKLSDYQVVEGSSVRAPHKIEMFWPHRGERMELEFGRMDRYDMSEAATRFRSPLQRGLDVGEQIRVDRPRGVSRAGAGPVHTLLQKPAVRP